jgi:hypothetical protein
MSGHIGEILVYRSTPIESMRQKIEGYLSWKWGLTQNLPNQHPYKFYPPLSNYSSIAINTSTIFATNFNNGNDIGFTNFSNTRLVSSPSSNITGAGSAYLVTFSSGNTNVWPSITFPSVTTANVTWCASIYRTGAPAIIAGIISTRNGYNGSTTPFTGMIFSQANANRIGYSWNDGSSTYQYDTGAAGEVPLCNWTHVAVTISPTEARFYINGSNINTRTTSHPSLTFTQFNIGIEIVSPSDYNWPGLIDNVRFYTSTLTSNEIQAIYYNTQFV